jgi:hypothetical protein
MFDFSLSAMKFLVTIYFLSCGVLAAGQVTKDNEPIKVVKQIFENYIKQQDSPDSKDNKMKMETALRVLQTKNNTEDLELLINVWMYYMPTDFPTQDLIKPIFQKDKDASVRAIDKRLKEKKEWETDEGLKSLIRLRDNLLKMK